MRRGRHASSWVPGLPAAAGPLAATPSAPTSVPAAARVPRRTTNGLMGLSPFIKDCRRTDLSTTRRPVPRVQRHTEKPQRVCTLSTDQYTKLSGADQAAPLGRMGLRQRHPGELASRAAASATCSTANAATDGLCAAAASPESTRLSATVSLRIGLSSRPEVDRPRPAVGSCNVGRGPLHTYGPPLSVLHQKRTYTWCGMATARTGVRLRQAARVVVSCAESERQAMWAVPESSTLPRSGPVQHVELARRVVARLEDSPFCATRKLAVCPLPFRTPCGCSTGAPAMRTDGFCHNVISPAGRARRVCLGQAWGTSCCSATGITARCTKAAGPCAANPTANSAPPHPTPPPPSPPPPPAAGAASSTPGDPLSGAAQPARPARPAGAPSTPRSRRDRWVGRLTAPDNRRQ